MGVSRVRETPIPSGGWELENSSSPAVSSGYDAECALAAMRDNATSVDAKENSQGTAAIKLAIDGRQKLTSRPRHFLLNERSSMPSSFAKYLAASP